MAQPPPPPQPYGQQPYGQQPYGQPYGQPSPYGQPPKQGNKTLWIVLGVITSEQLGPEESSVVECISTDDFMGDFDEVRVADTF